MGAAFSGTAAEGFGAETDPLKQGLGEIPESCVALVLINLEPPEICKLARLNRVFRQASLADCVWEYKLPDNYPSLVRKLFNGKNPESLSKRDIYARLCRPSRFDWGNKEVWMEKRSGGICVSISWKGMKITGIDDRRYWNHIPTDESRFHTIAYLQQIWWLEVEGTVDFQFPSGTYSLYFRLQLGKPTRRHGRRRAYDLDQIHGWDIKPVQFQFSTSSGHHATTKCYLNEPGKWVHYHVGDLSVENPKTTTNIKFSMTQIDCTHIKGGLCLDSVLILPKGLVHL